MPTEYSTDDKLQPAIDKVIAKKSDPHVSSLRVNDVCILGVFSLKHNAAGEEQRGNVAVALKKVPDLFQTWVFGEEKENPAKFVVVVDFMAWNEAKPREQEIMLHEVLSTIKAEKTEDGLKFSIVALPTINPMTVAMYGRYNEQVSSVGDLCAVAYEPSPETSQRIVDAALGIEPKKPKEAAPDADPDAGEEEEKG